MRKRLAYIFRRNSSYMNCAKNFLYQFSSNPKRNAYLSKKDFLKHLEGWVKDHEKSIPKSIRSKHPTGAWAMNIANEIFNRFQGEKLLTSYPRNSGMHIMYKLEEDAEKILIPEGLRFKTMVKFLGKFLGGVGTIFGIVKYVAPWLFY